MQCSAFAACGMMAGACARWCLRPLAHPHPPAFGVVGFVPVRHNPAMCRHRTTGHACLPAPAPCSQHAGNIVPRLYLLCTGEQRHGGGPCLPLRTAGSCYSWGLKMPATLNLLLPVVNPTSTQSLCGPANAAGACYIRGSEAPAKLILRDVVEMCKGVQHPTRGLFLRAYLVQVGGCSLAPPLVPAGWAAGAPLPPHAACHADGVVMRPCCHPVTFG